MATNEKFMPYITLPESDKDMSSSWGNDSYVLVSNKDLGGKQSWTLEPQDEYDSESGESD